MDMAELPLSGKITWKNRFFLLLPAPKELLKIVEKIVGKCSVRDTRGYLNKQRINQKRTHKEPIEMAGFYKSYYNSILVNLRLIIVN